MTAPQGPYLYDHAPEPLHTAAPHRRNWTILVILGATVLLAVASVLALPLVTGSPAKQSRQAAGVFLAAMDQGDTETTYGMLCDAERARLTPDQVAPAYRHAGHGSVVSAADATIAGKPVERVTVRWSDGQTTQLTVVNESGPHVCGTTS
jgi:hypothetical protein